jgi:hypothetical protein
VIAICTSRATLTMIFSVLEEPAAATSKTDRPRASAGGAAAAKPAARTTCLWFWGLNAQRFRRWGIRRQLALPYQLPFLGSLLPEKDAGGHHQQRGQREGRLKEIHGEQIGPAT